MMPSSRVTENTEISNSLTNDSSPYLEKDATGILLDESKDPSNIMVPRSRTIPAGPHPYLDRFASGMHTPIEDEAAWRRSAIQPVPIPDLSHTGIRTAFSHGVDTFTPAGTITDEFRATIRGTVRDLPRKSLHDSRDMGARDYARLVHNHQAGRGEASLIQTRMSKVELNQNLASRNLHIGRTSVRGVSKMQKISPNTPLGPLSERSTWTSRPVRPRGVERLALLQRELHSVKLLAIGKPSSHPLLNNKNAGKSMALGSAEACCPNPRKGSQPPPKDSSHEVQTETKARGGNGQAVVDSDPVKANDALGEHMGQGAENSRVWAANCIKLGRGDGKRSKLVSKHAVDEVVQNRMNRAGMIYSDICGWDGGCSSIGGRKGKGRVRQHRLGSPSGRLKKPFSANSLFDCLLEANYGMTRDLAPTAPGQGWNFESLPIGLQVGRMGTDCEGHEDYLAAGDAWLEGCIGDGPTVKLREDPKVH